MNTGSPLLVTRNLQTGYRSGGRKISVSAELPELSVRAGRLICLLGPNGSGKSTLLRTLAGLQPALSGIVEIGGKWGLSSPELARQVSLVLTDRVGGSNLDVRDLVALGRYPWSGWLGVLTATDKAAIGRAIEAADIASLLDRKVHTLSDGESQKVMLARALAQDTPILMLDEPTAHLDLPSRIRLMRLLHQLAREMNKGILLSTHELDLALQVADEVWLLQSAGPLHKGVPEDLVLEGVFEAAFAKEDVTFDRTTGVFRIHPEGARAIGLAGSGIIAFWTRRALQREGFTVVTEEAAASAGVIIKIEEQQGAPVWVMQAGERLTSIAQLLETLNHRHLS
ncbi:ABC transporter ATP-binding protein [Puia dinghuensis]|uniref:Iron(III) ABC transporter ATP-binding protein n=1 Tax=Puia dinghuensis TaxID=1792502 RepID=A0A8J2XU25_9BACT|nr:ABC transporter ATP-binding protein [Puia dinghuensis]GGB08003.1 iron(III) ABC transporter ATP-binding protein [Puia dinghuensis]